VRRTPLTVASLAWLALSLGPSPALADVHGRAYALYVDLPERGLSSRYHGDTGWLDARAGGSRSSRPMALSGGDVFHAEEAWSESHGDHCRGRSGAVLGRGHLLRGSAAEVTWTRIESSDEDHCCGNDPDDLPSSFVGLTFAGRPVEVTGEPNQTIRVPGVATLVLNERHRDPNERDHGCDDDAGEHRSLHLVLATGGEIVLGATRFDSDECCAAVATRRSAWGPLKAHYR